MDFSENDILYIDNHLIIVHKKNGQLTQGDQTGDTPLPEMIKAWIKVKFNKPGDVFLGVVHRLDRPVSGAVIFARTSKALTRMNELIKEGKMQKTYWAIVRQKPEEETGTLKHFIKKNTINNRSYSHNKPVPGAKYAELDYQVLGKSDHYYLLEILLKTGRHHQIRSQLSKIGSIIKGDSKYGFDRPNKDGSIDLHARSVRFIHPVSNEDVFVTCPVPDEKLWKSFEQLTR
ncbi:MAG: RNA pseudouridine synthase [Bacteroidales bacterium]|nr:RNA pseudouridine synthase [Bacteroidales bacterium]